MKNKVSSFLKKSIFTFILFLLSLPNIGNKINLKENLKTKIIEKSLNTSFKFYNLGFRTYDLNQLPTILPIKHSNIHRISSKYLEHRNYPYNRTHKGIDFSGDIGTPIIATTSGIVERAGVSFGYGNLVIIKTEFNLQTIYAHLNNITISKGDTIIKGQKIGTLGNTGFSTGPHLHYEMRLNENVINPLILFSQDLNISLENLIQSECNLKNIFQMEQSVKFKTIQSTYSLVKLLQIRKDLELKKEKLLNVIKSGKLIQAGAVLEELRVVKENLARVKHAQTEANRPITPKIVEIKDCLDERSAIYLGRKNGSLPKAILEYSKDMESKLLLLKKEVDSYNLKCTIVLKLIMA